MGFGFSLRSQAANLANTVLRSQGKDPISSADSAEMIQEKLRIAQAELSAISGSQRADATLQTLLGSQPNMSMTPEAAAKLSADLWVARQRMIDRDKFRERYGKVSNNSYANADDHFNQEFPIERYQREQRAIEQAILKSKDQKTGTFLLKDLRSGKLTPDQIDKLFGNWLGDDYQQMHRYFVTGGRK